MKLYRNIFRLKKYIFFELLCLFLIISAGYCLKPTREYMAIPSDYGIIYKEVTIVTSDSLTLKGWFFPAQDTIGIANEIIGRFMPVPQDRVSIFIS